MKNEMKKAITIVALISSIAFFSCEKDDDQIKINNPIAQYISDNPEHTSICLLQDGATVIDYNSDRMMPLASTLKIIVCIEYAEQCATGVIDPTQLVEIDELSNYYIEDADVAMLWLEQNEDKVIDGQIALNEVVKGMITYSANANTEWLMDKLGLEKINDRITQLGIKHHDPITYLVSSMFVADELAATTDNPLESTIMALNLQEHSDLCNAIHQKLKDGKMDDYGSMAIFEKTELQKAWSDRLPASTS